MSLIDHFLRPHRPLPTEASTKSASAWAEVDAEGRLVLPPELVKGFDLKPGTRVRVDEGENHFRLHRPVTQLTKVYIEPTVACNLDCITCFRNEWEQPTGQMTDETFAGILHGLKELDPIPAAYFGGIGEPLHHPQTPTWVAEAKALGANVELITNGTLLSEEVSGQLIEAGLDLLWVSIDGAQPRTFADVRLGAKLPEVVENMRRFAAMRPADHHPKPEIGVAFLAMKRNIGDLPEVIRLGKSFKAKHFSVSNLQPATADMQDEGLYTQVMHNIAYLEATHLPRLRLPKMDFDEPTREALFEVFNSQLNMEFAGNNWSGASDTCNFVESGTTSIAWNGDVSPCWPLMHTHTSYLHRKPRLSRKHVIGNVAERSLEDLWLDPGYIAYRERLHNFGFAPCSFCGGCDLSEANEEDCLGNTTFPVCGGCLWAQGIIQCP
ncbi:MAG: radical SAM protein [Gemmatimonadetes bacterium]|nr:SPASM domain-containing protein [Gemmatimonadota bacterium]NNM03946.1 radical SAM protein [Gemmatimonadota bacterium]